MNDIRINNLTRDYGNHKGIFNITLEIKKGETFGYLGPNGSGKTTTIRHLMGFIQANEGSCKINGMDCFSHREKIQQTLGYIPGEINFFDDMNGKDYLNFCAQYRHLNQDNRMHEMLERFELNPNIKIKKMSKGMKQKLGIVAAFMHNPDILILDEPTSGLDPLMQNRFIELLMEEKRKGKTILLSSHMFEEVEKTCDRIGIIKDGQLVTVETVDTLRKRHTHTYTVTLNSPKEAKEFAKDFNGICHGCEVCVSSKESLETIFLNYYGGGEDD